MELSPLLKIGHTRDVFQADGRTHLSRHRLYQRQRGDEICNADSSNSLLLMPSVPDAFVIRTVCNTSENLFGRCGGYYLFFYRKITDGQGE